MVYGSCLMAKIGARPGPKPGPLQLAKKAQKTAAAPGPYWQDDPKVSCLLKTLPRDRNAAGRAASLMVMAGGAIKLVESGLA